jgi:hypothetical protein
MLAELRTLVKDPTQLGQLPVFMSLLGAAVKQHRAHYALHALFRPVKLPGAVHQYLWQGRRPATMEQLQKHLVSMHGSGGFVGGQGEGSNQQCATNSQEQVPCLASVNLSMYLYTA